MQQRRRQRAERDQAEQDEGGGGADEIIERIGCVDGGKGDGCSCRGEDRRDVGYRQRGDLGKALLAAGPFADAEQRQRKQAAEEGTHAWSEQAGLDGVADQEKAAERERQPADPDHPACADGFLEARLGRRKRRWRGSLWHCLRFGLGRRNRRGLGNEIDGWRQRWRLGSRLIGQRRQRSPHCSLACGLDCVEPRPQRVDLVA